MCGWLGSSPRVFIYDDGSVAAFIAPCDGNIQIRVWCDDAGDDVMRATLDTVLKVLPEAFYARRKCCEVTTKFETAKELIQHLNHDDIVPPETPAVEAPAVEAPSWRTDVLDAIEGRTRLTVAVVSHGGYRGDLFSCEFSAGCAARCVAAVAAVAAITWNLIVVVWALAFDVGFFGFNVFVAVVRLALSIPTVPYALLLYASKGLPRLGDCRWCCRSSGGTKKTDDRSGGSTYVGRPAGR